MLSLSLTKKINNRVIEMFDEVYSNNNFDSIDIKENILKKILSYQTLHLMNMISAVKYNISVLDSSSTGTGKTYISCAVCSQLNLKPLIICPKSIVGTWKNILKYFELQYVDVVNYEALRSQNKKYVKIVDNNYVWNLEKNTIVIFDEAHKCKKKSTFNGKLLLSTKDKIKTMLLTATVCDKYEDFQIFGYILGLYKNISQGKKWIEEKIREMKNKYINNNKNVIENFIFPNKGSKMSMSDLGDNYPKNQISIECYSIDDKYKNIINEYYESIKNNTIEIASRVLMRQKLENVKVSIIIDLFEEYYEKLNSIAIFVNFISSFNMIEKYLNDKKIKYAKINGSQNGDENDRTQNINLFQNNEVKVILCMIQTGGISISLHDTTGNHPRVSLISPSFSHIELIQTLGRIYRSGSLSPCIQKIIYCANTYEEKIVEVLKNKKNMLDTLSDKDFEI